MGVMLAKAVTLVVIGTSRASASKSTSIGPDGGPCLPYVPPPPNHGGAFGLGPKPPRKTHGIEPVYPQEALAARVHGVVILEVLIGCDGDVRDAKVLRSIPLLDRAALDAARQWRYEPPSFQGQRRELLMTATVNFTLPD